MTKPKVEWDSTWDDDWQALQVKLEEEIEEERPHSPVRAASSYRYGFIAAQRNPAHEWSDVEADLYQDSMCGHTETEESDPPEGWDEVRGWARRGWLAARDFTKADTHYSHKG